MAPTANATLGASAREEYSFTYLRKACSAPASSPMRWRQTAALKSQSGARASFGQRACACSYQRTASEYRAARSQALANAGSASFWMAESAAGWSRTSCFSGGDLHVQLVGLVGDDERVVERPRRMRAPGMLGHESAELLRREREILLHLVDLHGVLEFAPSPISATSPAKRLPGGQSRVSARNLRDSSLSASHSSLVLRMSRERFAALRDMSSVGQLEDDLAEPLRRLDEVPAVVKRNAAR